MTNYDNLNNKVIGVVDSSPYSELSGRIRINNRLSFFLESVGSRFRKVVLCAPLVRPESPQFNSRTSIINIPNIEIIGLPDGDHIRQGLIMRRALNKVDFIWLFYGHAAIVYYLACIFQNSRPFGIQAEGDVLNLGAINVKNGFLSFIYRQIGGWLEKRMARGATFIMVVGKSLYLRFSEIAEKEKVYNILPLIDFRNIQGSNRSDTCNNPKDIICLFVGRISYAKGIQHLLEAIALLKKRGRLVKARIVGDGEYLPVLKDCAAKLDVLQQVVFTGHIAPGPSLWAEYEQADIFVLPSFSEGLPKVLYEASALRLPLITTGVGGIGGIFTHEKDALFIDVGSSNSIADAIVRLITDPSLRRRLIANNREIAFRAYKDTSEFGDRFITLIKKHFRLDN